MRKIFFFFLLPALVWGCGSSDDGGGFASAAFRYINAGIVIEKIGGASMLPDGSLEGCVDNGGEMEVVFRIAAAPLGVPDTYSRLASISVTEVAAEFGAGDEAWAAPSFTGDAFPYVTVPYNNEGVFSIKCDVSSFPPFSALGDYGRGEFWARFRLKVEENVKSSFFDTAVQYMDVYVDKVTVKGRYADCGAAVR